MIKILPHALTLSALLVMFGCTDSKVSAPKLDVDPATAAQAAIAEFDKNSDLSLSMEELKACPALAFSLKKIDKDKNGQLSQQELEDQITSQVNSIARMVRFPVKVTLNGKALSDAIVTAVPVSFMGENTLGASGKTISNGLTMLVAEGDGLSEEIKKRGAMQSGFYRLEVTHPTETIPSRYNTNSILGVEVSNTSEETQFPINIKTP